MIGPLSLLGTMLAGLAVGPSPGPIAPGGRAVVPLPRLEAGATYRVAVDLPGSVGPRDRVEVALSLPGGHSVRKALHAGDPGASVSVRPAASGEASLSLRADAANAGPVAVRVDWARRDVGPEDRAAIEAEPNDSWREANPLTLGRPVTGSADDAEDLDNADEGRSGIDWFRFEVPAGPPVLAYFFLELLDRDVAANLRVHRLDPAGGGVAPFEEGKDPTEVVHDRERERYSTHLSRVLAPGTYFVEVVANHPDYVLRTRVGPAPPLADDPRAAVDLGLQYLLEAGDAWFAQTPRAGHRYTRAANLHDAAVRCTACHASTFPVEASLVGQGAGYPIRAKQSLLYLTDRLANGPAPLYGGEGLYWQRYIAIPLQAQGKQGGVLLDYARQVDGRDASAVDRFGPFLRTAWRGRWELPADESNGVVPLDGAFGSAWRDWRVLDEMTRRTRQVAYAAAADGIADLFADPALDARVANLQDRMHRLHAWTVIDAARFASRIRAEAEALLDLQAPDGGWHELGTPGRPGAVYPTGQMLWTLMTAGVPRDDPRVRRGLAFLLARQQPFGGWFETTTHENFRTPMRETRYALEALALGFPRGDRPLASWGNRDGGPARLPRPGPLAAILADLDDLWDVPEADRPRFAAAIVPLLGHPDPAARSAAAACLGRLGDPGAAGPLARALADPAKGVSRAAAWGLRRLANRGIGLDALRAALADPDPAARRGAARVFAQQAWGLDGRHDLAGLLIDRAADPDLPTRLEAIRALRSWFYRTDSADLRRRIVGAYLDRMAVPDEPVVRRALSEGMYILLDENLGGGVSLGRTLAILPERSRARALAGRVAVERDILLGPILAALESGNTLQREALVRSFDGAFLPGRLYARRPTGMIDVGNDREFGFLYEPPADLTERVCAALLLAGPDLAPDARAGAIRLAGFFGALGRGGSADARRVVLRGLVDPAEAVRGASRDALRRDLDLAGMADDPETLALIVRGLRDDGPGRRDLALALARSADLASRPAIAAEARRQLLEPGAGPAPVALAPLLRSPGLADAEAVAAAARLWPLATEPGDRLVLLDAALARAVPGATSGPLASLLRSAGRDFDAAVRGRALEAVAADPRLAAGRGGEAALLAALGDDASGVRRRALALASPLAAFWESPEARERLRGRLVDPDGEVRAAGLAVVARHDLARADAGIARRVRTLADRDPARRDEALAALRAQGLDPAAIPPESRADRPHLPSLATFRARIDPLLTRPGEDGASCASCHANQNGFRIVAPGPGVTPEEALATNYRSALEATDRLDPEASLLLRKPQGRAEAGDHATAGPTALAHAGGARWDRPDHPALQAIRAWLAEGPSDPTPTAGADGYRPGHGPGRLVDGDLATAWRTETEGAVPGFPHEATVDLGTLRRVDGLLVVPDRDDPAGGVRDFEVGVSRDGAEWGSPVARGSWRAGSGFRAVALPGTPARFVRLRALSGLDGGPTLALAEILVDSSPLPDAPRERPDPTPVR